MLIYKDMRATELLLPSDLEHRIKMRNTLVGCTEDNPFGKTHALLQQMLKPHASTFKLEIIFDGLDVKNDYWSHYRNLILDGVSLRQAVNELLELLRLRRKFCLASLANRVRAVLREQAKRNGIVKAQSPPVILLPSSLHPIKLVA